MVATAKVTWSEDCRITNATVAKTWITSFFNNLAACGLVQTSDTGQLDPSTIAAVPAAGSYFGYRVYRFNDTQQSNKPVFLRFAPYVGSYGGANCGGVAVTIGFATDGAGNITGANTGLLNFFNGTAGSQRTETATATPCYAVHGEGYFGLCLHLARCNSSYAQNSMLFLTVTRPLNSSNAPTADGIIVSLPKAAYSTNTNSNSAATIDLLLRTAYLSSAMGTFNSQLTPFVGGQDAAAAGGNTQIQRTFYLAPAVKPNPALALYWGTSMPVGDQFDVAVDGVTRTYITLGTNTGAQSDIASGNASAFAMLWGTL